MNTVRGISTFSPFSSDFDRLFENWNTPSIAGLRKDNILAPSCDIEESEGHYLISAEMPGFKKDDIKVDVNGNLLTISAERFRENANSDSQERRYSERQFGRMQRSFTIPEGINVDQVVASYEDGVLHLMIPKADLAKAKQIKIGNGGVSKIFGKLLPNSKGVSDNGSNRKDKSVRDTSENYRKAAS